VTDPTTVQPFPSGLVLSEFAAFIEGSAVGPLETWQYGPTAPATPKTGEKWHAVGAAGRADGLYHWNGSAWVFVFNPLGGGVLTAIGGTLGGNLNANGFKITGSAAGSAGSDLARIDQVLRVSGGGNVMSQTLNMTDGAGGGYKIQNVGTPTAPGDAVRYGDFKSGRANLTEVPSSRSTTGDIDLNFVPRMLWVQLRGSIRTGAGSRRYSSNPVMIAQPLPAHNVAEDVALEMFDHARISGGGAGSGDAIVFTQVDTRIVGVDSGGVQGFRLEVGRTVATSNTSWYPPNGDAWTGTGVVHWAAWR
jgi:hypothetical protein